MGGGTKNFISKKRRMFMNTQEKLEKIVRILDSKKAEDIQVIGITNLTIIADYFVIATGTSTTQVKSLADEVDFQLGQLGIEARGIEGVRAANWIVLDYNDIVVHVFYRDTRAEYQLERLWADGEQVDISHLLIDESSANA
jgi:ribosome-associated protein